MYTRYSAFDSKPSYNHIPKKPSPAPQFPISGSIQKLSQERQKKPPFKPINRQQEFEDSLKAEYDNKFQTRLKEETAKIYASLVIKAEKQSNKNVEDVLKNERENLLLQLKIEAENNLREKIELEMEAKFGHSFQSMNSSQENFQQQYVMLKQEYEKSFKDELVQIKLSLEEEQAKRAKAQKEQNDEELKYHIQKLNAEVIY